MPTKLDDQVVAMSTRLPNIHRILFYPRAETWAYQYHGPHGWREPEFISKAEAARRTIHWRMSLMASDRQGVAELSACLSDLDTATVPDTEEPAQ